MLLLYIFERQSDFKFNIPHIDKNIFSKGHGKCNFFFPRILIKIGINMKKKKKQRFIYKQIIFMKELNIFLLPNVYNISIVITWDYSGSIVIHPTFFEIGIY